MKKISLILLVLFFVPLFVGPATAASNTSSSNGLNYNDFFKPKESVQAVQDSPLGTPLNKINLYAVGIVICLIFIALVIALLKYVWGDSESSSRGLLKMGSIVLGVMIFMACAAMIFSMFTWQF